MRSTGNIDLAQLSWFNFFSSIDQPPILTLDSLINLAVPALPVLVLVAYY